MCYKVSTPARDQLEGYFQKEINQNFRIAIEGQFPHFYHADGFARPFLPFTASENPDRVELAQWKLLPFIVKTEKEAWDYANTLNARAEDLFTKFSYKHYIGRQRGLLWVTGFFEPHHPNPKETIPYYVKAEKGEPFTLGCVYANWVNHETGEVVRTFSIITTPPNELMGWVHNQGQRMPLIIRPEDRARWLGPLERTEIEAMMRPLPDGYLEGYPVSKVVYKKGIDTNIKEAQERLPG